VLKDLFATKDWIEQHAEAGRQFAQAPMEVTDEEMRRISFLQTPNQVLGIFEKPVFAPVDAINKVSLMLDTIQDPGNLGTILRCADWFGVQQIICSVDCVDIFNPKTVQSTMGSICRVQVVYTELQSFIHAHQVIPVYAATLQGSDVRQHPPITEGIILIGNESKGIHPKLLSMVNHHITIPQKGTAESLNAAVATGIILSHLIQ
jgi:TrmH family RNA methyltransferase